MDHTVGYVIFLPVSYSFPLNICNALEVGEKAKGKDIFLAGLFCFFGLASMFHMLYLFLLYTSSPLIPITSC